MVSPEKALRIYQLLVENGIRVWICGGWGIDALLGEHTRPHHDLDVLLWLDDVPRMCALMARHGYTFKDVWEENRWVTDVRNNKIATAFILHDQSGDEIDVHALRLDESGNAVAAWEVAGGFALTREELAGVGQVAGVTVQTVAPAKQMRMHSGYVIPEKQYSDLEGLHKKFGVDYPPGFSDKKQPL